MTDKGKVLLYWDYELQKGADRVRWGPETWGEQDYIQTERILDILDEYQIKSTFAVLGYAALDGPLPYHAPQQIRKIATRGHEIASHTWEHEWVPELTNQELVESLKRSKEQIEQAFGQPVISFAPPWNAPTRFLRKTAPGFYDHRYSHMPKIDIPKLCRALHETGYRTARIAYEPLHHNLSRHILKRVIQQPTRAQWAENILYFKVNAAGFAKKTQELVKMVADRGGLAVIFAHPHSLIADNDQNERYFLSFLDLVKTLKGSGRLVDTTPAEVYRVRQRISA